MASRNGAIFTDLALYRAFASRKHHEKLSSSASGSEQRMIKRVGSDGDVGRQNGGGGLDLFGWRTHRSENQEYGTQEACTRLAPLTGCTCFDQDRMGASAPEFDQVFESSAPRFEDEDMAPSAPELTPTALYQCFCLDRTPSAPLFDDEDEAMEEEDGEDGRSFHGEEDTWSRHGSMESLNSVM